MSTITETTNRIFDFFDYDPKSQYPAPDGFRLVTCLYRAKDGEQAARPNSGMFVPDWLTEEFVANNLPLFVEYFVSYLQSAEDARVKEAHKNGSSKLGEVFFSSDNLLAYLDSTVTSGRLSGEQIEKWFDASDYKLALIQTYTEKVGEKKAGELVEFVKTKLAQLASPKVVWQEKDIDKFLSLLDVVKDESMGRKLVARLQTMKQKAESAVDLLDIL